MGRDEVLQLRNSAEWCCFRYNDYGWGMAQMLSEEFNGHEPENLSIVWH